MAGINRTTGKATDLITFSRASGGTALRKISYGSELVTNGTFDTDTSGWTAQSATIASVGSELAVTIVIGATNCAFQALSVEIGVPLLVRASGRLGTANGSFRVGNSIRGFEYINVTNPSADFQAIIVPTASTIYISALVAVITVGATAYFDNISVKEVLFDQPDGTLTLFNHPTNIPRIEYAADGTVKGLLIEEARTNGLTYSEAFDNAYWLKYEATAPSVSITTPDGSLGGNKFTESTATDAHALYLSNVGVGGQTYAFSTFVKSAGDSRYLAFRVYDGANNYLYYIFDPSTGQFTQESVGSSSTFTNVSNVVNSFGNGWYRVSITFANTSTIASLGYAITDAATVSLSSVGGYSYTGDGTSGIYIWGAQLEAGSFPTSYIPTSGATATRAADIASISVDSFGYRQDAGTVVVEWNSDDDTAHIANFYTDASNRWVVLKDAGNQKSFVSDGGTAVMNSVIAAAPSGDNKSAMSISSSSGNGVINGGAVVSDTSVSVPAVSNLAIGKDEASNYYLNGHIKSIAYYPRRLSNAQLQELTA